MINGLERKWPQFSGASSLTEDDRRFIDFLGSNVCADEISLNEEFWWAAATRPNFPSMCRLFSLPRPFTDNVFNGPHRIEPSFNVLLSIGHENEPAKARGECYSLPTLRHGVCISVSHVQSFFISLINTHNLLLYLSLSLSLSLSLVL